MNIADYHQHVDLLFNHVEAEVDLYAEKYDADIDYETHGNVLTISFENGSKIIINTQEPLLQVWMATRNQGYHFDFIDNKWICNRSQTSFDDIFSAAMQAQII